MSNKENGGRAKLDRPVLCRTTPTEHSNAELRNAEPDDGGLGVAPRSRKWNQINFRSSVSKKSRICDYLTFRAPARQNVSDGGNGPQ
jgi:hypothetical protein